MVDLQTTSELTTVQLILKSLGLTTEQTEKAAEREAYRIDFEQHFTIELQELQDSQSRISARIFSMGKSLQVQDNQLKQAMQIFAQVQEDLPAACSLAISDHDNCLRMCIELTPRQEHDLTMKEFNEFVQIAFAFKHTYLKHKSGTN